MDFLDVVKQARTALQSERRMTYRTLKRQFAVDEEALDDLKAELIYAKRVAIDEDGRVLVWTAGETPAEPLSQTADAPATIAGSLGENCLLKNESVADLLMVVLSFARGERYRQTPSGILSR